MSSQTDNQSTERLLVACECGKRLKVSARHAGKKVKCPACGQPVPVPVDESTEPEPAAAQPPPLSPPRATKSRLIVTAVAAVVIAGGAALAYVIQARRHLAEQTAIRLEVADLADDAQRLAVHGQYAEARQKFQAALAKSARLDRLDPALLKRIRSGAEGRVPFEGQWITVQEKQQIDRRRFAAAQKAKGLVEFEGRWITPEQKQKLQRERFVAAQKAKGLVEFEGRWITPADQKRIQQQRFADAQRAKGLVLRDGRWVKPQDKSAAAGAPKSPQPGAGSGGTSGPLERAAAARTAMLSARKHVRDLPAFGRETRRAVELARQISRKKPRPGSLDDVIRRALEAEVKAGDSMKLGGYHRARELFTSAERLYRQAAKLQDRTGNILSAKKAAWDARKRAEEAFKGEARPASLDRGIKALTDADKALKQNRLERARRLYGQARKYIAEAQAQADLLNALQSAQDAWEKALAGVDQAVLTRHAPAELQAAKETADQAEKELAAGRVPKATELFKQAKVRLTEAAGKAKVQENLAKAEQTLVRLKEALEKKDKFTAMGLLAEVARLAPNHSGLSALRQQAEALPWPNKVNIDLGEGVSMELILIAPGDFMMGSDRGRTDEKPVHKVTIAKPFYLGRHEVTREQWQAVMGREPGLDKDLQKPITRVSWVQCQTFLRALRKKAPPGLWCRLPSEAEWEYACRAGSKSTYCFGDDQSQLGRYAWYLDNSENHVHPVGQKKPNAWGLYDMHGNVREWCQDVRRENYQTAPTDGTAVPETGERHTYRVLRGGAYNEPAAACRSAIRQGRLENDYSILWGFRVAAGPK